MSKARICQYYDVKQDSCGRITQLCKVRLGPCIGPCKLFEEGEIFTLYKGEELPKNISIHLKS